jgi:hypothetical protein
MNWQAISRFGDAHPWLLPSLAAIITLLLTGIYKSTAWARRFLRRRWEHWEDNLIAAYLTRQVNQGPFEADDYGHIPRVQRDCSILQIAAALDRKPVNIRGVLKRLEEQDRARQRAKSDYWSATDYQMQQPIGKLVKVRLDYLEKRRLAARQQ